MGFKISGNTNEMFLDDDGMGNVRVYYLVSGIKTVQNATQGTIDYATGQITLNSLDVNTISNIRGSASTVIEVSASPSSNDIVPVRDQILEYQKNGGKTKNSVSIIKKIMKNHFNIELDFIKLQRFMIMRFITIRVKDEDDGYLLYVNILKHLSNTNSF